jgi:CheY-like chemotaxis protein
LSTDSAGDRLAKVLLVDDRRDNLLALEAILQGLPVQAVGAESGEEALKHLLVDDFALILLDAQMPVMDGFETARHIKRRERTRHVPIIFLTAADRDAHLALRGYAAGAVDYLTKPFDPWVLRAKVSVFVDLWTKTQQLQAQAEATRRREAELRSAGVAVEEVVAILKTALAASGELGREQTEKALAQLTKLRANLSRADQGQMGVV